MTPERARQVEPDHVAAEHDDAAAFGQLQTAYEDAKAARGLLGILVLIEPNRRSMPDIDLCAGDGTAVLVHDAPAAFTNVGWCDRFKALAFGQCGLWRSWLAHEARHRCDHWVPSVSNSRAVVPRDFTDPATAASGAGPPR